jgi:hypothetical protein
VSFAKPARGKILEDHMNRDAPLVFGRPLEAGVRQVLSLSLGAIAVGSLIFQHGFEFLRRFSVFFTWLDLLLALGFAGLLIGHFLIAQNMRDAIHERRSSWCLRGSVRHCSR